MNLTVEEIRLANKRRCILMTMCHIANLDLSASSKEFAQFAIRNAAKQVCPSYINEQLIEEAALNVIECLSWN